MKEIGGIRHRPSDWSEVHSGALLSVFRRRNRSGFSKHLNSRFIRLCSVTLLAFLLVTLGLCGGSSAGSGTQNGNLKASFDQVVFISGSSAAQNIFTMDVDGTDQKQITSYGNLQFADPCCTTPDKSKIIFTLIDQNDSPGTAQIYIINSDGTGLTNLSNNTGIL